VEEVVEGVEELGQKVVAVTMLGGLPHFQEDL
jgi:hypothetical protein